MAICIGLEEVLMALLNCAHQKQTFSANIMDVS